ncbi:MAG: SOS response-associated peptidase [Proteobacteria bacterium]|nr:SOS response-associated peptidase [Pseudomonadota bacterium]
MCGRFALATSWDQLHAEFLGIEVDFERTLKPRYNISPSQEVLIIPGHRPRTIGFARWGLMPRWTTSLQKGTPLINARSETLPQKISFKDAYKKRRCLIPSSGFFEWKKEGKQKQPYFISLKERKIFAFAGLWESWSDHQGNNVFSCTVITAPSNSLLSAIHHRMPVIIPNSKYDAWLDSDSEKGDTPEALLVPFPSEEMEFYPVSNLVNNFRNDTRANIEPIASQISF